MVHFTSLAIVSVAFSTLATAAPFSRRQAKPFTLSNGQAAQALNRKFATLTASSTCAAGENACVGDQFAQCVNGNFVIVGCAGGLKCAAVPLVNSAGTSIICDTPEDALARIAITGATGGLTGDGSAPAVSTPAASTAASPPPATTAAQTTPIKTGTQFITGACTSDADCASACCGFRSGKCAGPVVAQERDGGCGFGDAVPNNRAAVALGFSVTPQGFSTATAPASAATASTAAAPAAPAAPAGSKPFTLSNGQAAQALNRKFATLTSSSSCDAGENACVGNQFAQCVGGKFVIVGCAGGLTCAAVPLVNSAGTSIICDTPEDVLTRISNTGATGGLTGN